VAEADEALHLGPSQVDIAVLEADLLGGLGGVGHGKRRGLGGGEKLQPGCLNFHLAGGDVLVDRLAAANVAPHADDGFGPQLLSFVHEGGVVGTKNDLGQALAVADVDKDQMAHVACLVDPAAQDGFAALIGGAQGAGIVGALEGLLNSAHGGSLFRENRGYSSTKPPLTACRWGSGLKIQDI